MFSDAALGERRKRTLRGRSVKRYRMGVLLEQSRAGEVHKKWFAGGMASARSAQVANRER